MIYTTIPKLNVNVSRLGFGCMRFPTLESGKIDREKALDMIDLAYKSGVNYYDTAYGYHNEESEDFVREALSRYPRDSFFLADKLPLWLIKEKDDTTALLEKQLGRCGVEYFDFYLMHAANAERWKTVKEFGVYDILREKKNQGIIRALGFSYHGDYDTFADMIDTYEWDFVQIQTNYIDVVAMDSQKFHDKLNEKGIPCIVMEPVRGGFLANPPEVALEQFKKVNDNSPARWALRWCLSQHNMPIILSGMSSLDQVRENLETFSQEETMSEAEKQAIETARAKILDIKTVPCTACGYCMDCVFGVNIPEVFSIYNQYKLFQNGFRAWADYGELSSEHSAEACTQCGACAPMCPQSIDIPGELDKLNVELVELGKQFA